VTATFHVPSPDGVSIAVHDLGSRPPGGLEVGGRDVGGRDNGGQEPETLLICHATGFCGRAYEPFAAELTHRFHVLALDFRGHGDSSEPANGSFDWGAMADDLIAVVDHIAHGAPICAFGHSLGGGVLLLAEARRPGLLRAAYLFEPIVIPDPGWFAEQGSVAPPAAEDATGGGSVGPDPLSVAARRRRPVFPSKAEALARYASRPPLNVLQAGALAAYVEHGMAVTADGQVRLKCSPESEAATFDAPGKPTTDAIRSVDTPVTVAIGTTERGWTPAMFGPAIAEALPNGRLERHPLLGHFGPLQGPVTVAAMLLDALG
jgi:pimeloyl-ACP methyl ester carboxylesterase